MLPCVFSRSNLVRFLVLCLYAQGESSRPPTGGRGRGKGKRTRTADEPDQPPPVVLTEKAAAMPDETHAWLRWDRLTEANRNELKNQLAELYTGVAVQPRCITRALLRDIGANEEFEQMFEIWAPDAEGSEDGTDYSVIWWKIFTNSDPAYREFCLEFFSSLKFLKPLDEIKDIIREPAIRFRCGNVWRQCSVAEFGAYVGMYSEDDLNSDAFCAMLKRGVTDSTGFPKHPDPNYDYFATITDGIRWHSDVKANSIKDPVLRLLQKLICRSYLHRSTQWDKVYGNDLWAIRLFADGGQYNKYICPPYALLEYFQDRHESKLTSGQFITTMVKHFGCFEAGVVGASAPVFTAPFTYDELVRMRICRRLVRDATMGLLPYGRVDIDVRTGAVEGSDTAMPDADAVPPTQTEGRRVRRGRAPPSANYGPAIEEIAAEMRRVRIEQDQYYRRHDQEMGWIGSALAYSNYHHDRYQTVLEPQLRGEPYYPPAEISPYQPPQITVPDYRQGGGYYYSQPQGVFSQEGPVQFGSYAGGSSSGAGVPGGDSRDTWAEAIFGPSQPQHGDPTWDQWVRR